MLFLGHSVLGLALNAMQFTGSRDDGHAAF